MTVVGKSIEIRQAIDSNSLSPADFLNALTELWLMCKDSKPALILYGQIAANLIVYYNS